MKKLYFVTVISPYEEVFKKKRINLEKMQKEINVMKKDKTLRPFIKKIRERQIISQHTSQSINLFNPYGKSKGYRKNRAMMFFSSLEKAQLAIKENYGDLLESGSWGSPTFVVIEEYHEGFCLAETRYFFEVKFDKNRKFKVKKIKEPLWAQGSINFAF